MSEVTENPANVFAVILVDTDGEAYNTVTTLTDPVLWEWLHASEEFSEDETSKLIPIPGIPFDEKTEGCYADITVGSYENDKAQALSSLTGDPRVSTDTRDYKEALASVKASVPKENTYEGIWY